MSYQPIETYGIIGNLHTVALVGNHGSVDWWCFPRFDSPSIFATLLDDERGGCFSIAPDHADMTTQQFYLPETNVLVTRFMCADGIAQITDWMPVDDQAPASTTNVHCLLRKVEVVRGTLRLRMHCEPAFDYARATHTVTATEHGARFDSADLSMALVSSVPLECTDSAATAEWTLHADQSTTFMLYEAIEDPSVPDDQQLDASLKATLAYWRRWLSQCSYSGRWREQVQRSALVLKLLTYRPTGALIAAPTTSLPEQIGGERNWDYRYTWIRDAAFTVYALLRIGFSEEAAAFMRWLEDRCFDIKPNGPLHNIYRVDGADPLPEETLDHLAGYRGSQPVRIGNAAIDQRQLDIYGELLDAVYLFNKHGAPISFHLWQHLSDILDWVCKHWDDKDEGIWEVRGAKQQFVYSKVMCWVALDRGLRLAAKRSFPAPYERWRSVRDTIYADVMEHGWNDDLEAFVQSYGSDELDASLLIMPLVFFVAPTDPRMLSTIDAICRAPNQGGLRSGSLLYRYSGDGNVDGLEGAEGTFTMCSFWLIEALTRAGRFDKERLEQARTLFEQTLTFANHLGLFAEEIGACGEALGNFPQAFTHLSLISAAFNLDRALSE